MTELWSGGGGSRAQYLYKNSPWDQQNQEVLYFPLPAELAQLWGKTKAKQAPTTAQMDLENPLEERAGRSLAGDEEC